MDRVAQLEHNLNLVNEALSLSESADKLMRNPQFKKVIEQGYYKDEAIRLVSLLSEPNMQDAEQQQLIQNAMRGIGELKSWFNGLFRRAEQMKKMKVDIENELQYISNNPSVLDEDSEQ